MSLPAPRFIKKMKITQMISLAVGAGIIVGLLLGIVFAQKEIRREIQTIQDMKKTAALVELSTTLSSYVHEQQKERGASAVFLSSNGARFGGEMRSQRLVTDRTLEGVARALEKLREVDTQNKLSTEVGVIEKKIDGLKSLRNRIDALSIPRPEAIAKYTNLNQQIIQMIGSFSEQVQHRELALDLILFSAYLSAKDHAGIERALGASGFAVGFNANLKQNFSSRIVSQNALFEYYLAQASNQMRDNFQDILSSEPSRQVENFRQIALNGTPDEVAKISPNVWFDTITKKINLLKAHENDIANQITEVSKEFLGSANDAIRNVAIVVSIGMVIAACLAFYLKSIINALFQSVLRPLKQLAGGDYNVEIPLEGKNELGQVATAIKVFKDYAKSREDAIAERKAVLDRIDRGLRELAEGDFSHRIRHEFPEQYERLRVDFNESITSISLALLEVVDCTELLNRQTCGLSTEASQLSQRTERQSATLQGVAAAVEELTNSVNSAAESAETTARFVKRFESDTRDGVETAGRAVKTMKGIEASSSEIAKIVEMIEEIAFQTNLLALNAGVEAARAGDAGRGFAVVATEVRGLAARSSEAAREITTLIQGNSEKVLEGVSLMEEIDLALTKMVEQTVQISGDISNIATSSGEQSIGLTEVNTSINELDRVTQQNAGMVEKTTRTCVDIEQTVTNLSALIANFHLLSEDDQQTQAAENLHKAA